MSGNNKDFNLNDQNKLDILEEKMNKLTGIVTGLMKYNKDFTKKTNQAINSLEKLVYNIKIQNLEVPKRISKSQDNFDIKNIDNLQNNNLDNNSNNSDKEKSNININININSSNFQLLNKQKNKSIKKKRKVIKKIG